MEEDEENDRTRIEFQKFLQKYFPSNHQSEKVRQLTNIKKMLRAMTMKKKRKMKNLLKDVKKKKGNGRKKEEGFFKA